MASALTKSSMMSGAFKNVYDLIDSAKSGYTVTVKSLLSSFPDKPVTTKSSYPIVVVGRADSPGDSFVSFIMRNGKLSIDVKVEATNAQKLDDLCSEINNTMLSSEITLKGNKIYNMAQSTISNDDFMREKIKVHQRVLSYDFEFDYVVS